MTADVFGWVNGQPWLTAGATILSYVTLAGIIATGWHVWRGRCDVRWCVRPGQMPVEGTVWRTCCAHSKVEHHDRLRRRHDVEQGEDCVTY